MRQAAAILGLAFLPLELGLGMKKPVSNSLRATHRCHQRGTTIMESMVAVLIFSVGIVGNLGLMAQMTRAQGAAQWKSQASMLSSEIVAVMWADSEANLIGYTSSCSSQRCVEWKQKVAGSLPGGMGTVESLGSGIVKVGSNGRFPVRERKAMQYRQRSRVKAMQWPGFALRRQAGFTLIELMIGVLVGLMTTLAVSIVVVKFEGMRRTTSNSSDAQVSGAMAMDAIQRHVMSAGYGFTQVAGLIGCPLQAFHKNAPVALPERLVPVAITTTPGKPDKLRVFYSGKTSFSVPVRIKEDYNPLDSAKRLRFKVTSSLGVVPPKPGAYPGDLMLAGSTAVAPCQVFRASAVVDAEEIGRSDEGAGWNSESPAFPSQNYGKDDFLVNLGSPRDLEFSISDKKSLVTRELKIDSSGTPTYQGPSELASNVVDMRAFYGKDTTAPEGDGSIDEWSADAPTTGEGWQRVLAVRVAIVTRSTQFEREDVTTEAPYWDLGAVVETKSVDKSICDSRQCVRFRVDDVPDWKRYRYKILDTVIPMRNLVWRTAT